MAFAKQNPRIPEGINSSNEHPLKEFALLLAAVTAGLVFFVAALVLATRMMALHIPFRYEQKLASLYFSAQQPGKTGFLQQSDQPEAEAALRALGARLGADADLPPDYILTFHLIDADELPNAFATLGGHIFVTTGLLRQVSNENALAMVLAHEMAHVKLRHPLQTLTSGVVAQFFVGLVLGGESAVGQGTLEQVGPLTLLSFSRKMESAADAHAIALLRKHYGHLIGADEFFLKMAVKHGSASWHEMFETHPDIGRRIQAIQTVMMLDDAKSHSVLPLDKRLLID